MSGQAEGAGLAAFDTGQAVVTAVSAVQLAVQTAVITGEEVPAWAGTVTGLLQDWSQQLDSGGPAAGQAGAERASGACWRTSQHGVLAGDRAPAAPLSAYPLLTWLRLRIGLRRCLACGQAGNRSLQPTHPLVLPARARTWRCTDRVGCRRRRTSREGRR